MKNPFYYYNDGAGFTIEDRRSKQTVAIGVPHDYIHHVVDLLNADAEPRSPSVRELLKAFE